MRRIRQAHTAVAQGKARVFGKRGALLQVRWGEAPFASAPERSTLFRSWIRKGPMSDPATVDAPMAEMNSPPKGGNSEDHMDAPASAATAPAGGAGKLPVDDTAVEALLTLHTGSKTPTGNGAPAPSASGAGAEGIDVAMADAEGGGDAAKQPGSDEAFESLSVAAQDTLIEQQMAEIEKSKRELDELRPQDVRPPPPPSPPLVLCPPRTLADGVCPLTRAALVKSFANYHP